MPESWIGGLLLNFRLQRVSDCNIMAKTKGFVTNANDCNIEQWSLRSHPYHEHQ